MIRNKRSVPSASAGPAKAACVTACLARICLVVMLAAVAPGFSAAQEQPQATECWRGWGYLLDSQTGAYKSEEMLLVTMGAPIWQIGRPVELFLLDRASGLISETPSFTVVPENPRQYFRGRLNYMNTTATIEGSGDRMVVGLSHIEPAKPGVPAKEGYNRWACGLSEE